jgi:ATP-dependent RNA helicase RhlE
MRFKDFNFLPIVAEGIDAAGYTNATPIQEKAIPPICEGRDVIGLAQTGTGKTAAFALPILQRLAKGRRGPAKALIIAPTRELVDQIHETFKVLGKKISLRSVAIYGGVNINPQTKALKKGADIIVACPGRLLDHIGRGNVSFSELDVLVIDEADHMFDMGFLPDIRRIISRLPHQRQTLMFSATMPDEIGSLAGEALTDPVRIQVDALAPAETVSHTLYPVAPHLKTGILLALLKQTSTGPVLVFTRTKHRAKNIGQKLEKAGYRSASLQGNLSQNRRKEAIDGFRSGRYQVLVATDIAARGIDVSRVSHVINYDMPDTTDAYTHRIGRTGRAAHTGDAFTLVTSEDAPMVRAIERVLGAAIERCRLDDFDYQAQSPLQSSGRKQSRYAPGKHRPSPPARQTPASPPSGQKRQQSKSRRKPSMGLSQAFMKKAGAGSRSRRTNGSASR